VSDTPRTSAKVDELMPLPMEFLAMGICDLAMQLERELAAARADAARWQWIRRKLCLTGNGDGTCAMDALNLPVRIEGWPEPGEENIKAFCDAAIDAAMAKEPK